MPTKADFYQYILESYRRDSKILQAQIDQWRLMYSSDNALFGYMAPKFPLQMAAVAAFLYQQIGEMAYAHQSRDIFLGYRQFTENYPVEAIGLRPEYAEGIPPLDAVFDPLIFAPACERIREAITPEAYIQLSEIAADSLRTLWRFPEWGGHNRAALRAASLACCAHAFPDHSQAQAWLELADELIEESWGRWSIEDTMMYQAHWMRAMIVYAAARGRTGLADLIQTRIYLKAIVQLLSPPGILPDFGDSHWLTHSHWEWLALLEWGAAIYQDSTFKWAASRLWETQSKEPPNIYGALVLMLAWSWCDESVPQQTPVTSDDALDDLVMKKLVFRTGWEHHAAYACVNYRNEGDYARVARDYLRTNLAVSAEKMHHGHSDEGSFSMLVENGTLLLHESGYRERPPDGIYRGDFYHNRVVWRTGTRLPEGTAWDILHDAGHYRPVRTERLYQSRLGEIDIRRIRICDEIENLDWDRSIFFLPSWSCWVVVDTLLALRTAPRTFSSLWWTTDVLEQQGIWARTHIKGVQAWKNTRDASLWVGIPGIPAQNNWLSVESKRRSYQDEVLIASTWSGEHRLARAVNFVTVLWARPYQAGFAEGMMDISVMESQPMGRAIGITLGWAGESVTLVTLNDLYAGWLQEDIRPRYTAEQGWYQVDSLGSDGAFVVICKTGAKATAGMLNGTRLDYAGQNLFQMLPTAMFQEDGSHQPGITARFRWVGEVG
jgi:hypothetical protein